MQTQAVTMVSEEGQKIVVNVPTGMVQLPDGSFTFKTCYGRVITEEVRQEMQEALDKALGGRYWKSGFRYRTADLKLAKTIVEAVEFFQGTDADLEESCDGMAYIVKSKGYIGG